ncbi:MAG: transcription factor S [Nanoarchaeota archaeon]|nr:transcription factor S [Nanoarchaeota archaeon]
MEFCPKCGAVLIQKRKNDGCPRCSYSSKGKIKIKTVEKINGKKEEISVVRDKDNTEVFPIISETCKKCGNNQAYFWTVQTRASDEAETKFFKCTKCSYTWREYR